MATFSSAFAQEDPARNHADLIKQSLRFPAMPSIAFRVTQEIQDPSTSAERITRIIERDRGIAGVVMKLCNSAFFCFRGKIASIRHAVTLLGLQEIESLVVGASVSRLYRRANAIEHELREHSLGCAVASRLLAARHATEHASSAFLAGQMHDIGKLAPNQNHPAEFAAAAALAKRKLTGSLAAEQEVFGYTHPDVGALLLRTWRMPISVQAAALHHHDLSLCGSESPDYLRLTACVNLANHLCARHGLGGDRGPSLAQLEIEEAAGILGLEPAQVDALSETFHAEFITSRLIS